MSSRRHRTRQASAHPHAYIQRNRHTRAHTLENDAPLPIPSPLRTLSDASLSPVLCSRNTVSHPKYPKKLDKKKMTPRSSDKATSKYTRRTTQQTSRKPHKTHSRLQTHQNITKRKASPKVRRTAWRQPTPNSSLWSGQNLTPCTNKKTQKRVCVCDVARYHSGRKCKGRSGIRIHTPMVLTFPSNEVRSLQKLLVLVVLRLCFDQSKASDDVRHVGPRRRRPRFTMRHRQKRHYLYKI